jgi:hypothetical protein
LHPESLARLLDDDDQPRRNPTQPQIWLFTDVEIRVTTKDCSLDEGLWAFT